MQRNSKITEEETEVILNAYVQDGLTYSEINKKYGFSATSICKIVKGKKTHSEAAVLSRKKGRNVLTDAGRAKLSESGRKACLRSGKFYTKPERDFCRLLNEIGVGVRYPDFIKEVKGLKDDINELYVLFQYPIQRYVVDFADPIKKIVININGDYWHANPLLYDHSNLGKLQKVNVRQDKNKRIFLEKRGWLVVDIWESEISWNKSEVIRRLGVIGVTEAHMLYTHGEKVRILYDSPKDWSERLKGLWFSKKPRKERKMKKSICDNCKIEFEHYASIERKNCSKRCSRIRSRRVDRPSKDELSEMLSNTSWTAIGKKYGVSCNAVRRWVKSYESE